MQSGIYNEESEKKAKENGMDVIFNRCMISEAWAPFAIANNISSTFYLTFYHYILHQHHIVFISSIFTTAEVLQHS